LHCRGIYGVCKKGETQFFLNCPFNKPKYQGLLKGLEAIEVKYVDLTKDKEYRLESEYWNKKNNIKIETYKGVDIIELVQYGTSDELNEFKSGYPVLRLNEFDSYFIGVPEKYCNLITKEEFENLRLLKGDVLICRTNGNPKLVGRSAIVPEDTKYAYASYLFKIRPKIELINSETLVAFLRCKYGRQEIDAYSMVGNQTNFSPAKFREIDIPKFGSTFNNQIKSLFDSSFIYLKKSKSLYIDAEETLLQELGLVRWQTSIKNHNEKTLKESFLQSGRFDAEYYQTKYDELFENIINYKKGYEVISKVCNLKDKNFNPDNNETYKYIELSDIGTNGIVTGCIVNNGSELPSRARRIVNSGDLIVSSIEGSLSSCAIISEEYNNAICSTGFYVINSTKLNTETLLILFKSAIVDLMKRGCSGTILTAINKDEFLKIPLPIIKESVQGTIKEKLKESFALQKQSKELLEIAKIAVEMAIEIGEVKALNYIENKSKNII
jgi:type I restriction enzyme, S subunit